MGIIEMLLILVVVGFLCWLVWTCVPMPPVFRQVFMFVVVLVLIVFLLQGLGLLHTNLHL